MKPTIHRRLFLQASVAAVALSVTPEFANASEKASAPFVQVTWLGGPTVSIKFNGMTILTDPCFGDGDEAFTMGDPNEMFDLKKGPNVKKYRRLTPFSGVPYDKIDLVALSHAHEDHFDQKAQSSLSPSTQFLIPPSEAKNLKDKGFKNLDTLNWGQTRTYQAGDGNVAITAVTAYHSENREMATILGMGNGYWIEFSQGGWSRTLYLTGDTFGVDEVVKMVNILGRPDVMIPHLGGVGSTGPLGKISMGASELASFAEAISPVKILPIHHSTYELYLEPISQLAMINDNKKLRLDIVSEGTTVQYF